MFLFFVKNLLTSIYFYTILLCIIFFSIESFSLTYILASVSFTTAFGFLMAWFSYYFIYFLPLGIIISSLAFFYRLYNQKKIQAFYIFGITPFYILLRSFMAILIPMFVGILFSFFITNEDITYAKNYILQEFAKKAISSVPPKTFSTIQNYAMFFDNKKGDMFYNIFIHTKDRYIYSKEAYYKNGVLYVKNGEILSTENNKNYLLSFKSLEIQIYTLAKSTISENKVRIGIVFQIMNILLTPIFIGLGFVIISNINMKSNVFYIFLTFFVIIHEAIITLLKTLLLK